MFILQNNHATHPCFKHKIEIEDNGQNLDCLLMFAIILLILLMFATLSYILKVFLKMWIWFVITIDIYKLLQGA